VLKWVNQQNDKSTIDENTSNGGLGFIGSHTVVEQNEGFEVVIVDDLSNTSLKVLDGIDAITGKIPAFEKLDLRDRETKYKIFQRNNDISGVIHFAASKAVGESVEIIIIL
jgi:UDP-glucose 4-epimerase